MEQWAQKGKFYERLKIKKRFVEVRGGHVLNDYFIRRQVENEILN
ncbi:MAG: hypothetical protein QXE78_02670 [Nitrososphaeria archaeon]